MKGSQNVFRFAVSTLGIAVILASSMLVGAAADAPNVQYTNISPLPGAASALDSQGKPDGNGALQINIPIAYTPGWGYMDTGVFRGDHFDDNDLNNGSGFLGMGFGSGKHRLYVSGMQVSGIIFREAKALNAQVLLWQKGDLAVSGGYQDILRKEKDQRAPYLVATQPLSINGKTAYGTIGIGGGRFVNRGIAGLSMPLGEKFNAAMEYDGFQINTGLAWRPGGRDGKITLLAANNGHMGLLIGGSAVMWFGK